MSNVKISGTIAAQLADSGTHQPLFSGVSVTDDNPTAIELLTITVTGGGGRLAGDSLTDNGDGAYMLTGTADQVTAALEALTFTPGGNHPGATTTFTLSDQSSACDTAVTDSTTTVVDTDPAAAPTISGTQNGLSTTSETPVNPFANVLITDDNADVTETLTITVTGGAGTLAGDSLTDNHNGTYTLTGSADQVTSALHNLTFTPAAGAPGSQTTTTFTLSDQSSAYDTAVTDSTTTVVDTDPAVAPTISGTLANQTTTSEAPINPFANMVLTDANANATDTLTIAMSDATGTLAGDGLTNNQDGTCTLTGDAATVQSELQALSFKFDPGHAGATTTFSVTDHSVVGDQSADTAAATTVTVKDIDVAVAPAQVAANDFNGDGHSDILLQNTGDGHGEYYTWELNGTGALAGSGAVGWTPPSDVDNKWVFAGTGDFNGDGKSDILLQNTATGHGECFIWELNGTGALVGSGIVGWTPPSDANNNWLVKGTGDFNGDGNSDILLQNTAAGQGEYFIWELNGTGALVGSGPVGWTPPSDVNNNWVVKGTGDFNGDGKSDILLQNTATGHGECFIWELNGTGPLVGSGLVGWTPPSDANNNWVVKGTGDFNGDGKSDILLQNTATGHGECFIWELNGTGALVGSGLVGWTPPSADWHATA